jgi:glycosyltransferase involved in cell wall biosynthesis
MYLYNFLLKNMRIAVIGAKGVPPKQGGIEHYCAEVYPRIVTNGHRVNLYAQSSYTDMSWFSKYEFQDIQVISLPSLPIKGFDAFFSSAIGAAHSAMTAYDIVHFHALGPALFSWLPRIGSSARVVVTCQGLDWQRAKWGNLASTLIRLGERTAVRFAHEIIVVSEDLRFYFWETYRRKTIYIPNAPAGYAKSDGQFIYGTELGLIPNRYILFLGRLVPEKCPDLLIRAFQLLQPPGWKLVLVGGDSYTYPFTNQLQQLATQNPNIIFTGELRGSRLAEIVRGAGLFVLPSAVEGLPLAMLEAMREGIPVVASDIPSHQQLVGQERGRLFTAGNLKSCKENLAWALNHPSNMTAMAQTAQRYVQRHHSWDQITADNLSLYQRLLGLNPTKPLYAEITR